jgi:hypothetical protein|tara:strand:+ start:2455 stop:3156 length:702 start_codon:yes stop_codon:yes gene_type:complete
MTEILTDVKYSHIDITHSLSFNEQIVLDREHNLRVEDIYCNNIYYQRLINNEEDVVTKGFDFQPRLFEAQQSSTVIGGEHNECEGENSVIIGGTNNENLGASSVVLGGSDNQCVGSFTTTMGVNSVAKHDHTLVWNSDTSNNLCTTNTHQIMMNPLNGLHFRLPRSDTVWNEHLTEGMACFCWDPLLKQVCMKTKQGGSYYKSTFPTPTHEMTIDLLVVDERVKLTLVNPDHS